MNKRKNDFSAPVASDYRSDNFAADVVKKIRISHQLLSSWGTSYDD